MDRKARVFRYVYIVYMIYTVFMSENTSSRESFDTSDTAEREFLSTLTEDEFIYANTHVTHGWRLQTSQLRISGSKIGRNIEGR